MFHKTLFVSIILILVGLGMGLHYFSESSSLLKKYQKLGLVHSDLKYEKVEKSWGDQGLIFYQVQFPFLDVPMQTDKMTISLADTGMNLKFKNARIRVTEGLKKLYGSQLADNLNTYVPYKDFLNNVLTSMAVMGIDEFIGDISVNTVYSDAKSMNFKITMEEKNQPTIEMTGVIHIPIIGAHQISDLWNGEIDSAEIKIKESLFQRYVNYAKSRSFSLPSNIKQGILKLKGGEPLRKLKNSLR